MRQSTSAENLHQSRPGAAYPLALRNNYHGQMMFDFSWWLPRS
jgi:hypothetical protein